MRVLHSRESPGRGGAKAKAGAVAATLIGCGKLPVRCTAIMFSSASALSSLPQNAVKFYGRWAKRDDYRNSELHLFCRTGSRVQPCQ